MWAGLLTRSRVEVHCESAQLRMVLFYPLFDGLTKFFLLLDKFISFSVGGYARDIVIHLIPNPATGIEVVDKILLRCTQIGRASCRERV